MGCVPSTIVRLILPCVLLVGCGGGDKKPVKKPVTKNEKPTDPPKETEADRDVKRHKQAVGLVPDGSPCFPQALKAENAMRLELAAVNKEAVICATDIERSRLIGPVACWKIDLGDGSLAYQAANALPGRSLSVKLDDRCARGYCIPKDAKLPEDKIVHMANSPDGSKVVVISGDDAHIFDASARSRESGFSIRGDKGVTNAPSAVYWVGSSIFIASGTGPESYVFQFRTDGQAVGGLMTLGGGKETLLSTHGGSFVVLDEGRVAIAEKGFSQVTSYEVESGKRSKIVRTTSKGPCKQSEFDAYWTDGEVGAKCKEHMTKNFGHLIGADAVAGKTNLLVLLRGPRLGELAVLDVKNLAEKKSIKLPWCEGADEEKTDGKKPDAKADKAEKPKKKASPKAAEDPDAGGE